MNFKNIFMYLLTIIILAISSLISPHTSIVYGKADEVEDQIKQYRDNTKLYCAALYADHFKVNIEEALYRADLQRIIGKLDAELTEMEKETFAGLWIEHEPEYKVVVRFTKNGNEIMKSHIFEEIESIIEVRQANKSLQDLLTLQNEIIQEIDKLGIPISSGIDFYTNSVSIYVLEKEKFDQVILQNKIDTSEAINIIPVESLGTLDSDITGGVTIGLNNDPSYCTAGLFSTVIAQLTVYLPQLQ